MNGKMFKRKKVEFSPITAQRFMRVASEFSNFHTCENLTQSKIFTLLDLPPEERDDFVAQEHEINGQTKTVNEMTTRELQQTIKDKKAAEQKPYG